MSLVQLPADGKPEKLNTSKPLSYDHRALEELFVQVLEPESLAIFLDEIEERYISYLLRYPDQPGVTAEHQVHYLRKLRKALEQVKRLA
jgi:hypothetical protein